MTWFLIKLLIRVVVFGVAIGYVLRKSPNVKVTPKKFLPLVALVFAALNVLAYGIISFGANLVTLWTLSIFVPFLANAILLHLTSRVVKQFKVDGILPLLFASLVVTIAHFVLRVAHL